MVVFARAFTKPISTLHGFITTCLNSLTFYNRDFEGNAVDQNQQLLREVLVTVSSILIAGLHDERHAENWI
jgi:hypothetical protein